ncbi:MAG: hypothetical protein U5N55_11770 [Cypionkella sp.]|nr:hypothetical protein [Cypionkella sp.]
MAEVDPLILEITARLDRYKSELRDNEPLLVTSPFGRGEKAATTRKRQCSGLSGVIGGFN